MTVRYVVLCYSTSILADGGPDLAIVSMAVEVDGSTRPMTVLTVPNWKGLVDKEDSEYIGEIFVDLEQVASEERGEAFQRLSEMSAGRLRTRLSGECSQAELATVLPGSVLAHAS